MAGPSTTPGRLITEINVTPFVDIMLVLLIIFMIAAPSLYQRGLNLNLAKAGSGEHLKPASLTVSINAAGQVAFDKTPVDQSEVRARVKEIVAKNANTEVVIAADASVTHGIVIKVMDEIKAGGLQNIALLVDSH